MKVSATSKHRVVCWRKRLNRIWVNFSLFIAVFVVACSCGRGCKFIWDHVRMEDVSCYWQQVLVRYAKLLRWTPQRVSSYHEVTRKKRDEL